MILCNNVYSMHKQWGNRGEGARFMDQLSKTKLAIRTRQCHIINLQVLHQERPYNLGKNYNKGDDWSQNVSGERCEDS